jgi:hypothetical protein
LSGSFRTIGDTAPTGAPVPGIAHRRDPSVGSSEIMMTFSCGRNGAK